MYYCNSGAHVSDAEAHQHFRSSHNYMNETVGSDSLILSVFHSMYIIYTKYYDEHSSSISLDISELQILLTI